jgi:hypothetical protein
VKPFGAGRLELKGNFQRIAIGSFSAEFALYKSDGSTIFYIYGWK